MKKKLQPFNENKKLPKRKVNEINNSKAYDKVVSVLKFGRVEFQGYEEDDHELAAHIKVNGVDFSLWGAGVEGVAAAMYASQGGQAAEDLAFYLTDHLRSLAEDTTNLFTTELTMFGLQPTDFR